MRNRTPGEDMNFVVNNPNKFASTIPGALFQQAEASRKAAEASQFPDYF